VENPIEHLKVNEILDRFKKDIKDKDFLRNKVFCFSNHFQLELALKG
jgi:hypothetical protein